MGGVSETNTNMTNKNRLENKINMEAFVYGGIPEIITKNKKTTLRRSF